MEESNVNGMFDTLTNDRSRAPCWQALSFRLMHIRFISCWRASFRLRQPSSGKSHWTRNRMWELTWLLLGTITVARSILVVVSPMQRSSVRPTTSTRWHSRSHHFWIVLVPLHLCSEIPKTMQFLYLYSSTSVQTNIPFAARTGIGNK